MCLSSLPVFMWRYQQQPFYGLFCNRNHLFETSLSLYLFSKRTFGLPRLFFRVLWAKPTARYGRPINADPFLECLLLDRREWLLRPSPWNPAILRVWRFDLFARFRPSPNKPTVSLSIPVNDAIFYLLLIVLLLYVFNDATSFFNADRKYSLSPASDICNCLFKRFFHYYIFNEPLK